MRPELHRQCGGEHGWRRPLPCAALAWCQQLCVEHFLLLPSSGQEHGKGLAPALCTR